MSVWVKKREERKRKSNNIHSHIHTPFISLECPRCNSASFVKDGHRYSDDKDIQRFLCKNCGFRFSKNPFKECLTNNTYQLCVIKKAKKLDSRTETKTVAGDNHQKKQKFKGKTKYITALQNEGTQANSIAIYCNHLTYLEKNGAELYDPESVKAVIAKKKCGNATKNLTIAAYSKYLEVFDGTWKPPRYRSERKLPYVPTEKEIDCLINAAHKRLSCYLYLLKRTGLRSMEAWCLEWKDVDFTRNTITFNNTLKHGTPRMFKVDSRLIAMLNNLPKKSEKYIFAKNPNNKNLNYFAVTMRNTRKKLSIKLQNPNLDRISFHTFRHWFATTLYHRTKSLPYVQERLGHKSILTTMLYTHLITFEVDNYHSATAQTLDEAKKLVESGFEYVTDVEGVKLFRKPKC